MTDLRKLFSNGSDQ